MAVLSGLLAVLEAVENVAIKSMQKQIRTLRKDAVPSGNEREARSAGDKLVAQLRARKSETHDELVKETVSKLGARLEKELAAWSPSKSDASLVRTLQVAETHLDTLSRPFGSKILEAAWFDPRPARVAAHGLAAAAVAKDGRDVVERARGLAACVAQAELVDVDEAARLRTGAAKLLALARSHLSAGGAHKGDLAEQCRVIYAGFAQVATLQHRELHTRLQKMHLATGDVVAATLRMSLVALGSDAASTLQTGFVWPAKSRSGGAAAATHNGRNVGTSNGNVKYVVATTKASPSVVASDSQLPYMGTCCVCKGDIRGRIVKAMNGMYHPEHFACTGCRRMIQVHESFMSDPQRPLQPVCSACSAKVLSQSSLATRPMQPSQNSHGPCGKCGRSVEGDHVAAMNKVFHPGCLQCGDCGRLLKTIDRLAKGKGGFIVCSACASPAAITSMSTAVSLPSKQKHPAANASAIQRTCAECRRNIGDEKAFFDGPDMLHRACFVCSVCTKFLGEKTSEFFVAAGKRQCSECYKQSMFKCFSCLQPLHKNGAEVQLEGHLYHLSCAPARKAPSKPLPAPVADSSPASSPPPSPPAARPPRWSRESTSDSDASAGASRSALAAAAADEDELDGLVAELMESARGEPERVSLQAPLMRTSRSSLPSGRLADACWACGEPNEEGYAACQVCGEASESGAGNVSALENWTVPEEDELSMFRDSTAGRGSDAADDDQLSALILELNDI